MKRTIIIMMAAGLFLASCTGKKEIKDVNPFFTAWKTPFGVPPFDQIQNEDYMPALDSGIVIARNEVNAIANSTAEPDFKNTIAAYDRVGDLLTNVMLVFGAQTSANTNDTLQALEVQMAPKVSAFNDEVMLNTKLFERIKKVYDNPDKSGLTAEESFLLENLYKEFVRNGALLTPENKEILKKLNQDISVLTVKFSQNVLAETNEYKLVIDNENDLKGLPENVIAGAAEMAKEDGMEGRWVFTTQKPSMLPFLTYDENRELRKTLYDAYITRGNKNNKFDNKKLLADVIRLRADRAKLLGYKSHADMNLENRMAKTPANVFALLNQLWVPALKVADEERNEMQKIIDREGGKFQLESYDWWYYAEKLRKEKYNIDDNELRPYFSLDNVREGAFMVANKLYGITFTPIKNIPLPHYDAMAFEVKEASGKHLGVLYMDFFPRESKSQGAWCGGYRDHKWIDGKEITPVVTLVCNFTPPSGDTPSLLSMDEVTTLFHEFGHALQGLFSVNRYSTTFPPMDMIELPSQIMEHWATEPEVLNMYAKNYKTGEVIPAALVEKIKNSSYFNTGFDNVELLAASMLDMAYYSMEAPVNIDVDKFEKEYLKKIGLMKEIEPRYHSTYFLHIVGGYDAGYYCYTWAAVLDNDAFEAFEENGIFDKATAESFRKNVLEPMGIVDAEKSYESFRGRAPKIDALLKNRGLN
jgi:peptidyl-dipeptidase Dcp